MSAILICNEAKTRLCRCLSVTASDQEAGLHDAGLSPVPPDSSSPQAKAVLRTLGVNYKYPNS